MVSQHTIAFVFGILGNLISFMVFLAPVPTFIRVYKKKSTEGFHSVPYVIALFSCMLWIYYALVKTDVILLITINSIGFVIETIYLVIFLIYAPMKAKKLTARGLVLLNFIAFGMIVAITHFAFHGNMRLVVLGWICVAFSVSVFVSPLSVMRMVIRTKSVEFLPFNLSVCLTISAGVWLAYGILSKDKYVALPNILGLLFGVVQMVLYFIYKDNKKPELPVQSNKVMTVPEVTLVVTEECASDKV